ncbi:uncharacterized protein LOC135843676 [Planococcus citri]|uniref:uncharacterized protein LOC135838968 n=1 Tax=Planococcus citri TaxID=170843 RepID=UPI0031F9646B
MDNRDADNPNPPPPMKPTKKPHAYTLIRDKKVKGEPHLMHKKDIVISAVKMGPDCKCKRYQCFQTVPEEIMERIFNQFYTQFKTKNEQDSHLTGLISMRPVQSRRPRVTVMNVPVVNNVDEILEAADDNADDTAEQMGVNPNGAYFAYKLRFQDREFPVCLNAFLSVHGVTRGRVRRLQNFLIEKGTSPMDKRGKHGNYPRQMPKSVTKLIHHHIASLRKRQSHYSQRSNPKRYYLHENLKSITQLHELFVQLYPDKNVTYDAYRNIFNTYNIGFALPRSDTCGTCDKFDHEMKLAGDVEAVQVDLQARKKAHLELVENFRVIKRGYAKLAQEIDSEVTVLTFDFMQNLPIPNIQTNDVFYRSQVWVYNFGVHNLGDNSSSMYVFDENNGAKGSNNVTSMLFHAIRDLPYRELILMADNCPGQNKNRTMVLFLYMIVHFFHMVPQVTIIFPVRGHTYLPNDADFALIKKKSDCETPNDWAEVIKNARKNPSPFNVIRFAWDDFINFNESLQPFFLKTSRPPMQIKSAKMICISKDIRDVKVRYGYNSKWSFIAVTQKNAKIPKEINLVPLYDGPLGFTAVKIKNMKHLYQFTKKGASSVEYYQQFFDANPTVEAEEEEEGNEEEVEGNDEEDEFELEEIEIELDDDDNSSGAED